MSGLTREQWDQLKDWVKRGPIAGGQCLGHRVELVNRNGTEATYKVICPDGSIYAQYRVFPVPHKSEPCVVWL